MAIIKNQNKGFALLVAVIFMSVMLALGLALGSLGYKQEILASSAVESQYAFYAADAALECVLYADQQQNLFTYTNDSATSSPSMSCDGTAFPISTISYTTSTGVSAGTANVSYLVVGGGGAGGNAYYGGGGGGGQVVYQSSYSITAQTYTVTVDPGATYNNSYAVNGGSSAFGTITAAGGVGGGNPSAGASGSGNAGGNNYGNGAGGGGGGDSSPGSNYSGINGGNGGNGTSNSITGSAVVYGGGGGGAATSGGTGGTGGTGGGGNGGVSGGGGSSGTANTGGGGGGNTSGNGGSGIVIISAPTSEGITATGCTHTTSGGNDIWTCTSSTTWTPTFTSGGSQTSSTLWVGTSGLFPLDSNAHCADVTIYKYSQPQPPSNTTTYLYSQGYDVPCNTVSSPAGARFVSRGEESHY